MQQPATPEAGGGGLHGLGETCDSHSDFPEVPSALRQIPETARALRFLGERFLHQYTSHLNSGAGSFAWTVGRPYAGYCSQGLRGGRRPPSPPGQHLLLGKAFQLRANEQGVPGGRCGLS